MEKGCEFCGARRAAIYCSADAAYLCLCCDAKVHSANTLSTRHIRSVICKDSRPFSGCPTADNFAALCGYKPDALNLSGAQIIKGNSSYILQQIVELKRLQLCEGTSSSSDNNSGLSLTQSSVSMMRHYAKKFNDINNQLLQDSEPIIESEDPFPFPFSSLNAEPLWLCKSPLQNSQLWTQNMEDLGVCEEFAFQDDLNIPEVDLTFRNFEDMFKGDQDPMRSLLDDDDDISFFSMEKDLSLHKLDNPNSDISMGSTVSDMDREISSLKGEAFQRSVSKLSTDDSDKEAREKAKLRYKEKKKSRKLNIEKQIGNKYGKGSEDVTRKRMKGRFVKTEEFDSDSADVATTY